MNNQSKKHKVKIRPLSLSLGYEIFYEVSLETFNCCCSSNFGVCCFFHVYLFSRIFILIVCISCRDGGSHVKDSDDISINHEIHVISPTTQVLFSLPTSTISTLIALAFIVYTSISSSSPTLTTLDSMITLKYRVIFSIFKLVIHVNFECLITNFVVLLYFFHIS